jgi:hypothetical protein
MNFSNVTKPKWANAEKTIIDCVVLFNDIGEEVPFTANPNDCTEHGREIFARCAAGEFGEIGEYVPPPIVKITPEPIKAQ